MDYLDSLRLQKFGNRNKVSVRGYQYRHIETVDPCQTDQVGHDSGINSFLLRSSHVATARRAVCSYCLTVRTRGACALSLAFHQGHAHTSHLVECVGEPIFQSGVVRLGRVVGTIDVHAFVLHWQCRIDELASLSGNYLSESLPVDLELRFLKADRQRKIPEIDKYPYTHSNYRTGIRTRNSSLHSNCSPPAVTRRRRRVFRRWRVRWPEAARGR